MVEFNDFNKFKGAEKITFQINYDIFVSSGKLQSTLDCRFEQKKNDIFYIVL